MSRKYLISFIITIMVVSSGSAVMGVKAAGKTKSTEKKPPVSQKVYDEKNTGTEQRTESSTKKPDFIMVATAYVDTGETKSRIHAGVGSVAVDRNIIPHGTLLYIEDYGLGLATDTGKFIKGKRLDVWFPEEETAKQWGRKTVKVWIVGQADIKKILSTGGKFIKY